MSDLDKLMQKLKKKEVPVEAPAIETIEAVEEDEDDSDEDEEDEEEAKPIVKSKKVEQKVEQKETPIETEEEMPEIDQTIEAEVGLFQNNGIFRRELILCLKELIDVHKVNTQTLIELKKIAGGENAKQIKK